LSDRSRGRWITIARSQPEAREEITTNGRAPPRSARAPPGVEEHEHLLEDVQRRLDENPQAMRQRRETVEHPFGTIKMRLGATHFLMKRLKNVRTEITLSVLAYNLTRVINILGVTPLIQAIRA
jgi:transposase